MPHVNVKTQSTDKSGCSSFDSIIVNQMTVEHQGLLKTQ